MSAITLRMAASSAPSAAAGMASAIAAAAPRTKDRRRISGGRGGGWGGADAARHGAQADDRVIAQDEVDVGVGALRERQADPDDRQVRGAAPGHVEDADAGTAVAHHASQLAAPVVGGGAVVDLGQGQS